MTPVDARTAELATTLSRIRDRIAAAARAAGRPGSEVTLIAVTKRFPVEDARRLLQLGVPDLGESRDQEARPKAAALPEARWHFVGQLQSNKAKYVARYAYSVHSVDRDGLVIALAAAVARLGRSPLPVYVQVSLDGDPGRGGVPPQEVGALTDAVASAAGLELSGVMAVAPADEDPRAAFARLREISEAVRVQHPTAVGISAGMSGDLEAAIEAGSTHVRVGTALLGSRTTDVG